MSKDYIDPSDAKFLTQLVAFQTALPTYATTLGITPAQINAHSADTDFFIYLTTSIEIIRNAGTQWTAWRNTIRDGGEPPATGTAEVPVLPTSPVPVAPGIETRFRSLANIIKAHPSYNEAIGRALGIIAETPAPPDLTNVQPQIAARINGSEILINWHWGKLAPFLDQCEIHVDRGDGAGFRVLTFDTTPNYNDTHPLPATPTTWTYKAIYRIKDKQVGHWSLSVPLLVVQG